MANATKQFKTSLAQLMVALVPIVLWTAIVVIFLVFPAYIANRIVEASFLQIIGASIIFVLIWFFIAASVIESLSLIYGFNPQSLAPKFNYRRWLLVTLQNPHKIVTIAVRGLVSYFLMLYAFATTYSAVSMIDNRAFNVGKLGFIDAMYFSIATAATVGYGDITPTLSVSRIIVSSEILLSMLYSLFIITVMVSTIAKKQL